MEEKKLQECLNKYTDYMEEIKRRVDVVTRLYNLHVNNNSTMTGFVETDIDLVYLQLRKITELIMFACIVANKSLGLELNKKLKRAYELKIIKLELIKYNKNFFPSPKSKDGVEKGILNLSDLDNKSHPYLDEEELFSTHGFAGNFLHAQREYQYGNKESQRKHLNNAMKQIKKIVALLTYHWISITKDCYFEVEMQGKPDKKVQVRYMIPAKNT